MKAITRYLRYFAVLIIGVVLGAILVLVVEPYPPSGWGPLYFPQAAPLEWRTYTEHSNVNGLKVASWYCSVLQGCDGIKFRGSDDPDCDYETCFSVRGVLQNHVVDAQMDVTGTKVLVSQVFNNKVSADEALGDAGRRKQYGFGEIIYAMSLLLLIFSWRRSAHPEKMRTQNRLLGTSLILLVLGGIVVAGSTAIGFPAWSPFRFAVSWSAFALGLLLIFGAMILFIVAFVYRVEPSPRGTRQP